MSPVFRKKRRKRRKKSKSFTLNRVQEAAAVKKAIPDKTSSMWWMMSNKCNACATLNMCTPSVSLHDTPCELHACFISFCFVSFRFYSSLSSFCKWTQILFVRLFASVLALQINTSHVLSQKTSQRENECEEVQCAVNPLASYVKSILHGKRDFVCLHRLRKFIQHFVMLCD